MQQHRYTVLPVFFVLLTLSCAPEKKESVKKIDKYYDLASLLEQQVQKLSMLNPVALKKAVIDGDQKSVHFQKDSSGWRNELDIFIKSDINKPVLKDSYSIKETRTNTAFIKEYICIDRQKTGIDYIKVVFDKTPELDNTRRIELVYSEDNVLYTSRRTSNLTFEKDKKYGALMKAYSITGKQKMIGKDTVNFKVSVDIQFKS